jgi:hypothetical protein
MSLQPRRVVGATLGFVVRGFAKIEAAVETLGTLLPLLPRPRYDVSIRCADGRYFRTELQGGTRWSVLARAQEMHPRCRVVSLTRLRRRPTGHGVMWGIE